MYEYKGYSIIVSGYITVYSSKGFIGSFATEQDAEEYIDNL